MDNLKVLPSEAAQHLAAYLVAEGYTNPWPFPRDNGTVVSELAETIQNYWDSLE